MLEISESWLPRKGGSIRDSLMFAEREKKGLYDDRRFHIKGFFLPNVDYFLSSVLAERIDAQAVLLCINNLFQSSFEYQQPFVRDDAFKNGVLNTYPIIFT